MRLFAQKIRKLLQCIVISGSLLLVHGFSGIARASDCSEWDSVFESAPDADGAYMTIEFLESTECPSCQAPALLKGYQKGELSWVNRATYWCYQGAGGCVLTVGMLKTAKPQERFIQFVTSNDKYSNLEAVVIGGLFQDFYYGLNFGTLMLERPNGRKRNLKNVSGYSSILYFRNCSKDNNQFKNLKIVQVTEIGDNKIAEIQLDFLVKGKWKHFSDAFVNCNENYQEVNLFGENIFLGDFRSNSRVKKKTLLSIWEKACRR